MVARTRSTWRLVFARRAAGCLPLLLIPGMLNGCARQTGAQPVDALSGAVVETRPGTGELSVRVRSPRGGERTVRCMVTNDSEIYINDMLSTLDDVEAGDPIRLLGQRDAGATSPAIVVTYARIAREHAPPAPPEFLRGAEGSGDSRGRE